MPIGCFLIRAAGRTILVDAGLGPYERGPFAGGRLLDELETSGDLAAGAHLPALAFGRVVQASGHRLWQV